MTRTFPARGSLRRLQHDERTMMPSEICGKEGQEFMATLHTVIDLPPDVRDVLPGENVQRMVPAP